MIYGIVLFILIFIIDSIVYSSKALKKFEDKWDNEPEQQRMFKRILIVLYAIITFVIFFYYNVIKE